MFFFSFFFFFLFLSFERTELFFLLFLPKFPDKQIPEAQNFVESRIPTKHFSFLDGKVSLVVSFHVNREFFQISKVISKNRGLLIFASAGKFRMIHSIHLTKLILIMTQIKFF